MKGAYVKVGDEGETEEEERACSRDLHDHPRPPEEHGREKGIDHRLHSPLKPLVRIDEEQEKVLDETDAKEYDRPGDQALDDTKCAKDHAQEKVRPGGIVARTGHEDPQVKEAR